MRKKKPIKRKKQKLKNVTAIGHNYRSMDDGEKRKSEITQIKKPKAINILSLNTKLGCDLNSPNNNSSSYIVVTPRKVPYYSSGLGFSYSQQRRAWVDPWEANPSERFINDSSAADTNMHRVHKSNENIVSTITRLAALPKTPLIADEFTSMSYIYTTPPPQTQTQPTSNKTESDSKDKFGAWDGVMAGCLLNIFGVIMFLRVGWIVGQSGIIQALCIIGISSIVTILTTLSMSAICTNGTILAGGAYYIISRTLGPAFGGSVGILLSFGNMVACSMYLIGFAETLVDNLHDGIIANDFDITRNAVHDVRIWSNITLVVVLLLALIGLKYVIKAQIALLVFIVVAILMFFIGSLYQTKENSIFAIDGWTNGNFKENLMPNYVDGYDCWLVLAIFFPAVTGIMAGANISGDLRNPSNDIPKGTLTAISISSVVYMLMALCVGAVASRNELITNILVMADVCVWDYIIFIGIYSATLSSAIACLVGAPRILMAIADDNIIAIPGISYFAKTDSEGNPVRGYLLSFAVAFLFNCVGELNLIAPLISQVFIIVYLIINFASFVMEISSSPGWRPSFYYFNRWTSLCGAILCLVVMFLLDWVYALLTTSIAFGLYLFISWKDVGVSYGGVFDSVAIYDAYASVLNLGLNNKTLDMNSINWRPSLLYIHFTQNLSQHTISNDGITHFVETLQKGHSLIFTVEVMIGEYRSNLMQSNISTYTHSGCGYLPKRTHISSRTRFIGKRVNGFCNQIVSETYRFGVQSALQMSGLGALKPNTIVLQMKDDTVNDIEDEEYMEIIRDVLLSGCGVMICCGFHKINWDLPKLDYNNDIIDIWWMVDDGGLILMLPYIMCLHSFFSTCRVRINLVTDDDKNSETYYEENTIKELIKKFRLDPIYCDEPRIIHVVNNEISKESIHKFESYSKCKLSNTKREIVICRWLRLCELIHEYSSDSSMIIVTLPVPTTFITATQYMTILQLMADEQQLPPTIIMRGNGKQTLTFHSE